MSSIEISNDNLVSVSDDLREGYENEIIEDESEENDGDTEWGLEGDFERNAFGFIIDDGQY